MSESFSTKLILALMRVFYYLLYKPLAWTYDWVAALVSLGKWNQWVLTALSHLTGPRVLELGHGPGHLQLAMAHKGLLPVGLDSSRQMGRLAYLKLNGVGVNPLLVNGYAQFIPFSSNAFNQVVATFPTPFIFRPDTLSEIYRTLAPGGDLVVLPAAWITGARFAERLTAFLFRATRQAPAQNAPGFEDQMAAPFRKAGFIVDVTRLHRANVELLFIIAHKPFPGQPA
jgi:ubiquinone/menaquinone biosynthesis C-methylase UbiE